MLLAAELKFHWLSCPWAATIPNHQLIRQLIGHRCHKKEHLKKMHLFVEKIKHHTKQVTNKINRNLIVKVQQKNIKEYGN